MTTWWHLEVEEVSRRLETNGKTGLSTLASAVHPYPTLGEINKKVAGMYLSTKIFSEPVKKGLKLFFNLRGRACEVQK